MSTSDNTDLQKHQRKMVISALIFYGLVILVLIASMENTPKEINGLHGYRTAFSMSSQENWTLANDYFNKCMPISMIIGLLIAATTQNYIKGWWKIGFILAMMILSVFAAIAFTEMYLDGFR